MKIQHSTNFTLKVSKAELLLILICLEEAEQNPPTTCDDYGNEKPLLSDNEMEKVYSLTKQLNDKGILKL
jgi:hypothetical protein